MLRTCSAVRWGFGGRRRAPSGCGRPAAPEKTPFHGLEALPHFMPVGWLAVGFIGVSSGVGYYLWLWALNHTTATSVTVFLALSPVSATILGALLLAESPSPTSLFGLACVALGIWLAQ